MRIPPSTGALAPRCSLFRTARTARSFCRRRGNVVLLTALLMLLMIASLALSIDVGMMYTMKTQLARSVDAAALAGAGSLVDGKDTASQQVVDFLVRNPVTMENLFYVGDEGFDERKTAFLSEYGDDLDVNWGHWNPDTNQFEPDNNLPSAVHVAMTYPNQSLIFGRALGRETFTIHAETIATYQPRDIMLVLDFSASMNDDSELRSIDTLGQTAVESNIYQMWLDLNQPTYGNMNYAPDWVTIPGVTVPASVKWRTSAVDVSATTPMQYVKLYYSNGNNQTFSTSAQSGTWSGTGSNDGSRITKCQLKIGGVWETFDFYNNSHIRRGLALPNDSNYPTEGTWDDYIEYARSHNDSMPWYDSDVYAAGYRRQFGVLTLINHMNKNKPENSQTSNLWQVSAQPVTAVKNAVDVFMDYIREVEAEDRVGLSVYNSDGGNGTLESSLTLDLDFIADVAWHRQAGHYHRYTNIGGGVKVAREELEANARTGAYKMIVLMTDGKANWVNGGYDTAAAKQFVLDEAALCAAQKIPIVTISLGAGADQPLMDDVAGLTNGIHFNIPGGSSVAEYSQELLDVFRDIANARPLKLVK